MAPPIVFTSVVTIHFHDKPIRKCIAYKNVKLLTLPPEGLVQDRQPL